MAKRVVAFIDGFNFYHPINHHQKKIGQCLQWLDYTALLSYYLQRSRKIKDSQLKDVYFFSALATHRNKHNPGTTIRHQTYINALKEKKVKVIMGNFKKKHKTFYYDCPNAPTAKRCNIEYSSFEEKETDVRIACKLLELAVNDDFDACMLLSADSDLVPAIETLKTLYPQKQVILVTPPSKAKIDKLKRLADDHVSVGVNDLLKFQFPDELTDTKGYKLINPWKRS